MQSFAAQLRIAPLTCTFKVEENDTLDHQIVKAVQSESCNYLQAHPTNRGGGQHGYTQILAGPNIALYNELTGTAHAFDVPTHPSAAPHIPNLNPTHFNLDEHCYYKKLQYECKQHS